MNERTTRTRHPHTRAEKRGRRAINWRRSEIRFKATIRAAALAFVGEPNPAVRADELARFLVRIDLALHDEFGGEKAIETRDAEKIVGATNLARLIDDEVKP